MFSLQHLGKKSEYWGVTGVFETLKQCCLDMCGGVWFFFSFSVFLGSLRGWVTETGVFYCTKALMSMTKMSISLNS